MAELFLPNKKIILNSKKKKTYYETLTIMLRFYIQTYRRPSTVFISITQPLLWLILFGALFQNAPIYLFEKYNIQYRDFLNPGIIVFTAFNSSINAGLNIIFDREFGFLNRILISPIGNKNCLIYSCAIHTWTITIVQIICIVTLTLLQKNNYCIGTLSAATLQIVISTFIIFSISNISIYSAFILPGHIEFISLTTLLINLPTLFASTALAPLSFMPNWLQTICCINPLTYAIEIVRHYNLNKNINLNESILRTTWLNINATQGFIILALVNLISFVSVKKIIKYKYDKN